MSGSRFPSSITLDLGLLRICWTMAKFALSQIKPPSATTSESRQTSTSGISSRQTSTSSFASTMGPGSRPPTRANGRPPTSMGFSQSVNGRQRSNTRSRPATALGGHGAENDAGTEHQQNGTRRALSLETSTQVRTRKPRGSASTRNPTSRPRRESSRSISGLSKQLEHLSLQDKEVAYGRVEQDQVISRKRDSPPPFPLPSQSDGSMEKVTFRQSQRGRSAARRQQNGPGDTQVIPSDWPPKTPTGPRDRDILVDAGHLLVSVHTTCKTLASSPIKSWSPSKQQPFLTKESNVTSFTELDVREQLEGFGSHLNSWMSKMAADTETRDEIIATLKAQGLSLRISKGRPR
jgi:hypothetical protein